MEMISKIKEVVMPGFDGTGPYGQGAMTGGGPGNCVVKVGDSGRAGPKSEEEAFEALEGLFEKSQSG
jgi:hypothetical protein